MNFRVSTEGVRRQRKLLLLRWFRYFLLLGGIAALSYCAVVVLDSWGFQAYQTWKFQRALKAAARPPAEQPASSAPVNQSNATRVRAVSPGAHDLAGSPLGRIEISSIGLAAMIMEGVDGRTLRHAVGHIPGTPLPGESGNVSLAGHRDTFFRALRNIQKDDEITLTTLHGSYRYRVDWTRVVAPADTRVLAPTPGPSLTLVACYPFYFVGPAPQRFIVRAHRISELPGR